MNVWVVVPDEMVEYVCSARLIASPVWLEPGVLEISFGCDVDVGMV